MSPALTSGMTSSLTDNWPTPRYVFDPLNEEFHFTLDVCADSVNHKVDRFFDEESDGLKQDWTKDVCWMNPPYGRVIGQWVKKAVETAKGGGDRRGIATCQNGYKMVDGVCHDRIGTEVHQWARQIRQCRGRCAIPVCDCGVRNTYEAIHQPGAF